MSNFNQFLIKSQRCMRVGLSKFRIQIQTSIIKNFGNKHNLYFCPCCGHFLTKFIDWSGSYRHVICPYCDSQPRHRSLTLLLKQKSNLDLNKPIKMLHIAPESSLKKLFDGKKNIKYITADLNNSSVDVKLDITQIPYDDNTFDVIICNHVLEHILDDRQAMRELLRVLKPNGWASLQVPIASDLEKTFEDATIISPEDRLRNFGQEDHVRWYGRDYPDRLTEVGFSITTENIAESLSSEKIEQYGLRSEEDLYFGTKAE